MLTYSGTFLRPVSKGSHLDFAISFPLYSTTETDKSWTVSPISFQKVVTIFFLSEYHFPTFLLIQVPHIQIKKGRTVVKQFIHLFQTAQVPQIQSEPSHVVILTPHLRHSPMYFLPLFLPCFSFLESFPNHFSPTLSSRLLADTG